jgi:glycosyltransferase involved in cell wall biosynthesis
MVILQLTGMVSTHYGAKEHYFVEFARACNKQGARCVLQFEVMPRNLSYLEDLKNAGAEIVILNTGASRLKSIIKIIMLIRSLRPTIVETHFVDRMTRILVPFIARFMDVQKCVAFVRNLPRKKKFILRQCYNSYDLVFAISEAVAIYLVERGVRPEIVHPHYWGLLGLREKDSQIGIKFRKEFGIPLDALVTGIIAFDTPFKGLDILLEAFSHVLKTHPYNHLLMIGVDHGKSGLPEMAERLGISANVHWAGIRDEGWKLLNAVDIYVQPSIDSEGLPNAVAEAMALKLPVVGTKVSGIPEAVIDGETGILVTPGSAEELGIALNSLINDPERRRAMGEAGHKRYLDKFDGEASIRKLTGHYFLNEKT